MKLLATSIFFLTAFTVFGQGSLKVPVRQIPMKNDLYNGQEKFQFKNIEIMDARPDTNKVGFLLTGFHDIYKLCHKNGTATYLMDFINQYYKSAFSDSPYSVLVVLKKLWISNFDSTLFVGNLRYSGQLSAVKIKVEFYLRNKDDYYPVTRIDSLVITRQTNSVSGFGNEINDAVVNACNKLFSINVSEIFRRKKYSLTQIEQFNNKTFDQPILRTTEYKKGVYMTFSDFLNNQPSSGYSSIDQKKYGDVLFFKDGSGNEYPSNKFWGYSDGSNCYVTSGKNFFKLERVQNTFEFYGIKNLRERSYYGNQNSSSGNTPVIVTRKPALDMFYYQVDMETGEVY